MPFKYRLRGCINFTRLSKPGQTEIIAPIVNRLLRIDATIIPTGKKILIGKIIPICQGMPDSISYKVYSGSELFLLPGIGTYSIRFISSGALQYGAVRFFEKIGRLSDAELRQVQTSLGLSLDIATDNILKLSELSLKTGLAQSFLRVQNSKIIQLLIGLSNMSGADTRNLAASIEALSNEMIVSESLTIQSSDFVQQVSGLYHAIVTLVKTDGTTGVQLSLADSSGDVQGLSQLIDSYGGDPQKIGIELTAAQHSGSEYPLYLLSQGRKLPAVIGSAPVAPTTGTSLGGGFFAEKVNDILTITGPMGNAIVTIATVSEARFIGNKVHVFFNAGNYALMEIPDFVIQTSNVSQWSAAQAMGVMI